MTFRGHRPQVALLHTAPLLRLHPTEKQRHALSNMFLHEREGWVYDVAKGAASDKKRRRTGATRSRRCGSSRWHLLRIVRVHR